MAEGQNSAVRDELGSIVDRLVRLEEQKRELAEDIKDVKTEAKARGFDVKALTKIVREKMETRTERARRLETEAIADLYRATLGMLDGTPLGDAARRRLDEPATEPAEPPADERPPPPPPPPQIGPEEIAEAREKGRRARRDGVRVIDNPFVAGDPRRAAWDEGWCAEAGSDGMDIPEAWRRRTEKDAGKRAGDGGGDGDA